MEEELNVKPLQQGPDERQAAKQQLENLEKAQVLLSRDFGPFQYAQVSNSKTLVEKFKEQVLSAKQGTTATLAPTTRSHAEVAKQSTKRSLW